MKLTNSAFAVAVLTAILLPSCVPHMGGPPPFMQGGPQYGGPPPVMFGGPPAYYDNNGYGNNYGQQQPYSTIPPTQTWNPQNFHYDPNRRYGYSRPYQP